MNVLKTLAIEQGTLYKNAEGKWCKHCPKCNGEQPYYDKFNAYEALKIDTLCNGCRHIYKPHHNSNKGKNQHRASAIHDSSKPTVLQFTVLQNVAPVVIAHKVFNWAMVSMFPVTLNCACGYSTNRKIPWLPFKLSWHCPTCSTSHVTHFE